MNSVGIHSMRTRSVMPGGGVVRRPLHVIMLADCSGSMAGPRIQALKFAIGASLWVTNPQIRSAGLYGDDAEPQGPAFRDISDAVL